MQEERENMEELDEIEETQSIILGESDANYIEKKLRNLFSFIVDKLDRNTVNLTLSPA